MKQSPMAPGATRPLVSIVTIFRDANEHFFAEAIRSVFAQTCDRWELLLVDDGSRDGSSVFARSHARRHPDRIRYFQHPDHANRGTGASRQLGIDEARGEFVAFLDADDIFLPEKLERQLAILRAHPAAAMVFGPTPHWYSWTGDPHDRARDVVRRIGVPPDTLVPPPELVRAFLARTADTPATCGILVRRAAIDAIGGFDPRFVDLFEDQAFFFRLCLRFPVCVAARHWDLYRRHPDSLCVIAIRAGLAADDYRPTRARGDFLFWVEAEFQRHDVRDPELHRLLDAELWPYRHPLLYRLSSTARRAVRWVGRGLLGRAVWRFLRCGGRGRR
jgi:glycosyltransferase involved in cell wall biosynthesis